MTLSFVFLCSTNIICVSRLQSNSYNINRVFVLSLSWVINRYSVPYLSLSNRQRSGNYWDTHPSLVYNVFNNLMLPCKIEMNWSALVLFHWVFLVASRKTLKLLFWDNPLESLRKFFTLVFLCLDFFPRVIIFI